MPTAPDEQGGPPEGRRERFLSRAGHAPASGRLAWILDECVRVPGTRLRFGLDPVVGLVPYGGEVAASAIGAIILAEAGKKGLPLRTLLRMGGNMLLNAAVGAIPVVGDLFSFWFKSNSRNYRLLDAYLSSERGEEARGGWWPILLIGGVLALVLLCNILAWILLWMLLYQGWGLMAG
jgi:hypothetical protein